MLNKANSIKNQQFSTQPGTKKITREDLECQSSKNGYQNHAKRLQYSAFSTAARKQSSSHKEEEQKQERAYNKLYRHNDSSSHAHTYDDSGFRKQDQFTYANGTALDKYKIALHSYHKQHNSANHKKPMFKQTVFSVPTFEYNTGTSEQIRMKRSQKQKQNSINNTNTKTNININTNTNMNLNMNMSKEYKSNTQSKQDVNKSTLTWASASKMQTAEVIRNLFGDHRTDYNLQYRKKKFFENFAKQI